MVHIKKVACKVLSLCNTQNTMERPLFEIQELKTFWRKQNFVFTNEQQFKYDKLIAERQKQVKSFYKDNLVYKA
jgi:hypothetical protein